MKRIAASVLILSLASTALAGDLSLGSPIDCSVGEDKTCYIQHFVDHDPSERTQDFACGILTYDTHSGTDFALRTWADMQRGVNVIASAPGVVKAVRDGMIDAPYDPNTDARRIDGRDCGNGVVIVHEGGWETQYCHLRQNSVTVQNGDIVDRGTPLGLVGMSGRASFPHIHLSVRRNGTTIDPYAPQTTGICGEAQQTLWDETLTYQPGGLISVGFAAGVPEYDDIKAGIAHEVTMAQTAPALVLWGFAFGSLPGDVMQLEILAPNGRPVFKSDIEIERAQAQYFRAGGRKTQNADWFVPGPYLGNVTLLRDGKTLSDSTIELTVTR